MWRHVSVILWLAVCVSGESAVGMDFGDICRNRYAGEVVPNPLDCQSFFICGSENYTLHYCSGGLYYNAERRLCGWPEEANCNSAVTAYTAFNETTTVTTMSSPTLSTSKDSVTSASDISGMWRNLRLPFSAFSAADGTVIDPMTDYDPQAVQCLHRGAYFLPHPRSCQKFHVCAFGHLLMHQCGRGTAWNYRRAQCEVLPEAECYVNSANNRIEQTTIGAKTNESLTATQIPKNSTGTEQATRSRPLHHPTPPVQTLTAYNSRPTVGSTSSLATTTTTATATTTPQTPNAASEDLAEAPYVPNCNGGIKYLADAEDCTHYFICIQGIPVGMYCPEGTFWDYRGEFCTFKAKAQCIGDDF